MDRASRRNRRRETLNSSINPTPLRRGRSASTSAAAAAAAGGCNDGAAGGDKSGNKARPRSRSRAKAKAKAKSKSKSKASPRKSKASIGQSEVLVVADDEGSVPTRILARSRSLSSSKQAGPSRPLDDDRDSGSSEGSVGGGLSCKSESNGEALASSCGTLEGAEGDSRGNEKEREDCSDQETNAQVCERVEEFNACKQSHEREGEEINVNEQNCNANREGALGGGGEEEEACNVEKGKEIEKNEAILLDDTDDDDELEIREVRKVNVKETKKFPVVSCVAWRTRCSLGKAERISYSTYFKKNSDSEGEIKENEDDDDIVELEEIEQEEAEQEEESSESDSETEKCDDDIVLGEWQDRLYASKRKFAEIDFSDPENDERPIFQAGSASLDFTLDSPEKKKLRPDDPGQLHIIESDNEPDLGSDKGLRSASSDSDWEDEIGGGGGGGGGGSTTAGTGGDNGTVRLYQVRTPGSGNSTRSYRRSIRKEGSGSGPFKYYKRKQVKGAKGLKGQALMQMLVDTMYGGDQGSFEQGQICNLKDVLPMVFCFEEEREVDKREEEERELDELWADFVFALESENIGTYNNLELLGLATEESEIFGCDQDSLCSHGKHDLILNDQIGVVCRNCSFISMEIRYILPAMASGMMDKSAWKFSMNETKPLLAYHDLCEGKDEKEENKTQYNMLNGTVWDLIPGIISTMYEHQREAIEFMWTNLAGGISLNDLRGRPRADVIGGCVICHAPGTGKTRLAIVFIQTYMKVFPDCRPVIIAPRGMLYTWEEEFRKWDVNFPFHILNTGEYTGKEDSAIRKLVRNETRTEKLTRLVKLYSWDKGNSILGVSYGLFKKLTSDRCKNPEDCKVRSVLLEKPGLLVLDEGHTPRNERSIIWKTLGKVKSEKRIILSGTPFQNNFLELYNILCLVRPQFAEKFLIKRPKKRGRERERDFFIDTNQGKEIWSSITSNVFDDNAEEVRAVLKPFVHIHNGNILQTLPGLRECVIVLNPSHNQRDVIEKMETIGSRCNFENEYKISLASIHPSLVTAIKLTDEEATFLNKELLENLRLNPNEGVKTKFVMEVVRLCEALKEKVLIFSQFIQPLSLIKKHLIKLFKYREGKEILQMDGKILPRYRQASIDVFNDPDSEARVLLASTRACCEGISLTGASRVVLLDVVWNPAVGRQAISRAYRIGQHKFVYTYNLITSGTSEGDKYDRQAEKDHLSKLVFAPENDLNNVRSCLTRTEQEQSHRLISQDKILAAMMSHRHIKDMFLKIYYPPTDANIVYTYNQIAPEEN